MSASIHSLSRKPIVAGIAVVFALSSCTVCATTLVTNCKDDGSTGTLRSAVAAAPSGDTVDASALTSASPGCAASKITLTMGEIVVNKSSLTIKGPGKDKLMVTALYDNGVSSHQYENRIFSHTGTGGLGIQNLTVSNGLQTGTFNPSRGGCIYSKGQVTLDGAIISSCAARTTNSSAQGGGIFAQQVQLTNSTVSGNYADAGANGDAAGGGIYDNGTLILTTSSVISNYAGHAGRAVGDGGGIVSHGNGALVLYSTIGNNTAGNQFGGWQMIANATSHLSMYNSTISGNHATHGLGGGLYAVVNTVEMTNSTIAFNTAQADDPAIAPGLSLAGTGSTPTAYLVSVLMSANVFGSSDTSHDATVVGMSENGSGNLIHIGQTFGLNQAGCPLLGPLRDNGGPTMTNALLSGNSVAGGNPAVDRGLVRDYNDDQRGYTRLADGGPDIGAYEVQQDDIIFNDSFGDGCP